MMTGVSVIGAGWYAAQNHIPVLASIPGVVLDGVCRLGVAELDRVRGHFGFAFASEDYRDVLARRPDAVVVASPHHLHHEHTAAALRAGAHVLCEKPMTLDPDQADDLVALAQAQGRHLIVVNGYNYLAGMDALRDLVPGVGRIEHVACSFVSATRAVFQGTTGLARWDRAFFRPDRMTWQDPERGGGFVWGQASHSVALLLWLTGLHPVEVAGRRLPASGVDLCHAGTVLCEGGAVLALSGAPAMPEGLPALLRLVITGDEGVLDIAVDQDRAALHRHDGRHRTLPIAPGQWAYDCAGPVRALVALARGGNAEAFDRSPARIGAETVRVLHALAHG